MRLEPFLLCALSSVLYAHTDTYMEFVHHPDPQIHLPALVSVVDNEGNGTIAIPQDGALITYSATNIQYVEDDILYIETDEYGFLYLPTVDLEEACLMTQSDTYCKMHFHPFR